MTGANLHDVSQLKPVPGQKIAPSILVDVQENLCADAGYVNACSEVEMRSAGYQPHIRLRGEERREKIIHPTYHVRRWVVEVCHEWLNKFRKLLVRYEKLHSTYLTLLHLAATITALKKNGAIYC